MTILFQLLTTLIFLALTPAIVLGVIVSGLMAIWRKGKPKAQALVVKPVEATNPTVTAPIDWNTVPVGRMDKGGVC
jgi:MFS superfamily sulfate permease-like transporter